MDIVQLKYFRKRLADIKSCKISGFAEVTKRAKRRVKNPELRLLDWLKNHQSRAKKMLYNAAIKQLTTLVKPGPSLGCFAVSLLDSRCDEDGVGLPVSRTFIKQYEEDIAAIDRLHNIQVSLIEAKATALEDRMVIDAATATAESALDYLKEFDQAVSESLLTYLGDLESIVNCEVSTYA